MPFIETVAMPDGTPMPRLGMGTWYLGERSSAREREIAALRAGITLIDTVRDCMATAPPRSSWARRFAATTVSAWVPTTSICTCCIGAARSAGRDRGLHGAARGGWADPPLGRVELRCGRPGGALLRAGRRPLRGESGPLPPGFARGSSTTCFPGCAPSTCR